MPPELVIMPDPQALAQEAAVRFLDLSATSIHARGRFTVALAGGSIPRQMYALLAKKQLQWDDIHLFWGDERSVPPAHVDSNFRMANDTLLSRAAIPVENIHRIHGELNAAESALAYTDELHRFFGDQIPRFDLILLGLGEDGHTASLFPSSAAIHETAHWVAPVEHRLPPPPLVDRVTLTYPTLNAAANIMFLVSGAAKADPLTQVLQGPYHPDVLPAQIVAPVNGHLSWLVDREAARKLIASK